MAKSRASYDHNLFTVSIVKLNLRKSTCLMVVVVLQLEPMLLGRMQMKQAAFAYIEVLIQVHVQRQSTVHFPVSVSVSLSVCVCVCASLLLCGMPPIVFGCPTEDEQISILLLWFGTSASAVCTNCKLQYCLALDLIQFLIIRSTQPETAVGEWVQNGWPKKAPESFWFRLLSYSSLVNFN